MRSGTGRRAVPRCSWELMARSSATPGPDARRQALGAPGAHAGTGHGDVDRARHRAPSVPAFVLGLEWPGPAAWQARRSPSARTFQPRRLETFDLSRHSCEYLRSQWTLRLNGLSTRCPRLKVAVCMLVSETTQGSTPAPPRGRPALDGFSRETPIIVAARDARFDQSKALWAQRSAAGPE